LAQAGAGSGGVVTAGDIGSLVGGIGGGLVVVLGVIVGLKRLFGNGKSNGNGEMHELIGVTREMRDGIFALRQDMRMQALEQGHLQKSVEALHNRFDRAIEAAKSAVLE